jgi:hypothetical protein
MTEDGFKRALLKIEEKLGLEVAHEGGPSLGRQLSSQKGGF